MENKLNITPHISKRYDTELEQLREDLILMGSFVEKQLSDALNSLYISDIKLAKSVIKQGQAVNQHEVAIDARCVEILALRQPAAGDLRLILAVSKTATDLERIGDLSEHLARMSKKLINKGLSTKYFDSLQHLGTLVKAMLSDTLDTLARLDLDTALQVIGQDKTVDKNFDALSRQLSTYMMEDPRTIKKTLRLFNAARALERIGDHCENICEHTIFLVAGEDVRYKDIDEVRLALSADEEDTEE